MTLEAVYSAEPLSTSVKVVSMCTYVPEALNDVDVYCDTVGAEWLDTVLPSLNTFARAPAHGILSQYNAQREHYAVNNIRLVFDKGLGVQGSRVSQNRDRWNLDARAVHDECEAFHTAIDAAPGAFVEHPQVVADRIERVARSVGDPGRVIAGTDCGFDTSAGMGRVAEDVVWAKLRALCEGARLASERLL